MFLEMARPQKSGVDYFPMDTDFFGDKKIKLLKAEFGARGLMIVLSTFCRVYSTNGYYASFDRDDALLIAEELGDGITPELVREVVQGSVKRSLFDEGVFNQFGVLTSPGIQRRYIRAAAKRDDIPFFEEYWLLDINDPNDVPKAMRIKVTFKSVSGGINPVSGEINLVSGGKNAESKGKESKVKESKVNVPDIDDLVAAASVPLHEYLMQNLFQMSPGNWQALHSLMEDGMTDELVRAAVDKATGRGIRGWNYVQSILNEWVVSNVRSLEDVKRLNEDHKRKQRGEKPSGRNDREPEIKPGENPFRRKKS